MVRRYISRHSIFVEKSSEPLSSPSCHLIGCPWNELMLARIDDANMAYLPTERYLNPFGIRLVIESCKMVFDSFSVFERSLQLPSGKKW